MKKQEDNHLKKNNNIKPKNSQLIKPKAPVFKTYQKQPGKLQVVLSSKQEKEIKLEPIKQNQIEEHMNCNICCKLAINASECIEPRCGKMMCSYCIKNVNSKQKKCPFCRRQPFQIKESPFRQQINILKRKCEFCQLIFKLVDEQLHYKSECSFFNKIQCKFCPNRVAKSEMVDHTLKNHKDKLSHIIQMLYEGTQQFEDKKVLANNKLYLDKIGKSPRLGSTGKFYCGKQLQTKCSCCNGYCGPTNGQNCRDCMKLDIKRFGLKKGQFLNSWGKVCWKEENVFCCGTLQNGNYNCNPEHQCYSCKSMNANYIRYEGL